MARPSRFEGASVGRSPTRSPGTTSRRTRGPTRRTSWSSSSTTPASRTSAATAPTSTRRTSTASRPTGCSTRTSTSRRCARRRARRCSPAATTTRSACAAVSNFNTGFPNMPGHISNHAATVAEVLRDEGYATFAVGKWHLCPMERRVAPPGPFDQWPLPARLRPLLRVPRGRDRPVPPRARLRQPPGRPAAPVPTTATTSARTSSTSCSGSSTTPSRSGPTGRSSATSRSARRTRRTRRRPSTSTKYRGRFDDGLGRRPRARGSRASSSSASSPRAPSSRPATRASRPWDDAVREPAAARGAAAGGVRRVPRPHRRPDRPARRRPATSSVELDNTLLFVLSDNGAQPGGRAVRRAARDEVLQRHPRDARRGRSRRIDDIGGPHSHTNYPWGWAQAGNTPFKWYKQNTHEGGVHVPLIVHWPRRHRPSSGGMRATSSTTSSTSCRRSTSVLGVTPPRVLPRASSSCR